MNTREQLLKECLLNKSQIKRLYGFSQDKANKVFEKANAYDDEELKGYRIEEKKVRSTTVSIVTGIPYKILERNILN